MKAKIIGYDAYYDRNICVSDDGGEGRIDVCVDGGLGNVSGRDLIGKTVVYDYTHPYISIARNVRLVESE